mmetsp:Transcript_18280/g.17405  ORF Transcript_18280/g.17405 Transcript_18280/m.17405 type:complete len:83 (-) Transcript_18280:835-1083(-)
MGQKPIQNYQPPKIQRTNNPMGTPVQQNSAQEEYYRNLEKQLSSLKSEVERMKDSKPIVSPASVRMISPQSNEDKIRDSINN